MKRLLALAVSLALIAVILASVDRSQLWDNLRKTRLDLFVAALLMFVPQIAAISWRWRRMVGNLAPIPFGESVRLVLASQTMNLVLPSKLGDLTKAYFLKRTGALDLTRATQVVVMEKLLDVAALCCWMVLGIVGAFGLTLFLPDSFRLDPKLFAPALIAGALGLVAIVSVALLYFVPTIRLPLYARWVKWLSARPRLAKVHRLFATSHEVTALLQRAEARPWRIVGFSLLIWFFHLIQIYLFFLALRAPVPLTAFASFVPLAIFVGLLPFTIAGIGTRDGVLILLFSPTYYPANLIAAVAFFISLRYIVPAACGLPFLHRYLAVSRTGTPPGGKPPLQS